MNIIFYEIGKWFCIIFGVTFTICILAFFAFIVGVIVEGVSKRLINDCGLFAGWRQFRSLSPLFFRWVIEQLEQGGLDRYSIDHAKVIREELLKAIKKYDPENTLKWREADEKGRKAEFEMRKSAEIEYCEDFGENFGNSEDPKAPEWNW